MTHPEPVTWDEDAYREAATVTGPVCAECSFWDHDARRRVQVRHASAASVRECHAKARDAQAQARADLEAERLVERFFEERGGSDHDPYERDRF